MKPLRRAVGLSAVAGGLCLAATAPASAGTIEECHDSLVRPCAVDDSATTAVNTLVPIRVLDNDLANVGAALIISNVTVPDFGTVTVDTDAMHVMFIEYTPPTDFVGLASFMYEITEDFEIPQPSVATVTVQVTDPAIQTPEPSALTLLAAGCLALWWRNRARHSLPRS